MSQELLIEQSRVSYVDLPAIIGGAALALGISLVLVNFGAAVGLTVSREYHAEGENAWAGIIVIGLWGIWVQVLASMAGGYLAGRMRRPVASYQNHEREMRDGAHGLLVWAIGTIAAAMALGLLAALMAITNEPDIATAKTPESLRMEHNATIILAFITASTSLVAAVVSWWAATRGGQHRDNSIDHSHYVSFNRK